MAVFTVHEPPDPPQNRIMRAEALVFLRDGFSWAAALVPVPWLMLRGEWLLLGAYTVAALVLAGILAVLGAQADWVVLTFLAFNVLFGFEAYELRRSLLAFRGWREIGMASGRTREDCERRFFDAWLQDQSSAEPARVLGPPEVRKLARGWLGARAADFIERGRRLIESRA